MAEAAARLKNYPTSPRKMRYVADMVRGKDVNLALDILQHSSKHGAKPMYKLLLSAIDNWEKKNEGLRVEDAQLIVRTLLVDGGTTLKRWLPAPHGRAYKIRKRSNHITLVVDSKVLMQQEKPAAEAKAETPVADAPVATAPETTEEAPKKKTKKKKAEETAAAES
ncbi:MAG: 50S ribosomal protein L22 [Chitinophagales bacterium]|nr:50S ribosomal protein L22 [Bacteroidota bacterium]MBX7139944.1 50S ribosomal protein L22 [Chitinophagales bacterium]